MINLTPSSSSCSMSSFLITKRQSPPSPTTDTKIPFKKRYMDNAMTDILSETTSTDRKDEDDGEDEIMEITSPSKDKGKGKMKMVYLPELPEEVWMRIFEIFYEDISTEWQTTSIFRDGLTPVLLSRYHARIAIPVLYRHPYIGYRAIQPFIAAMTNSARYTEFNHAEYIKHITIRPSPIIPSVEFRSYLSNTDKRGIFPEANNNNTAILTIHPSFEILMRHLSDLLTFTLKDTLVLHQADSALLFAGLKVISPKKARLEFRMWDLYTSSYGQDIIGATTRGTYTPHGGRPSALPFPDPLSPRPRLYNTGDAGLQEEWRDALFNSTELDAASSWPENPRYDNDHDFVPHGNHILPNFQAQNAAAGQNFPLNPHLQSQSLPLYVPTNQVVNPYLRLQPINHPAVQSQQTVGSSDPSSLLQHHVALSSAVSAPKSFVNPNADLRRSTFHSGVINDRQQRAAHRNTLFHAAPRASTSTSTQFDTAGDRSSQNSFSRHNQVGSKVHHDPFIDGWANSIQLSSSDDEDDIGNNDQEEEATGEAAALIELGGSAIRRPRSALPGRLLPPQSSMSTSMPTRRDDVNQLSLAGSRNSYDPESSSVPAPRRSRNALGVTHKVRQHRNQDANDFAMRPVQLTLAPRMTSQGLARQIRLRLLDLIANSWSPRLQAFSFVAFDPQASMIVRSPELDFWTQIAVPHIRVHLPRTINSLEIFKGEKEVMWDRIRRRRDLERTVLSFRESPGQNPTNAQPAVNQQQNLQENIEDHRIVGGDGSGGDLINDQVRLFEIEINSMQEMRDEVWINNGDQLPPQLCRILAGEHDWTDVHFMEHSIDSYSVPYVSYLRPDSPATTDFDSPTFSFMTFGSDEITELDEDEFGLAANDTYDREKAEEQARMIKDREVYMKK
ncbi:uncharacterized protein IL334_001059 [Kwoniella shivajii]|uniref:F-box domain-containing protein n=1 Tax=Kwoniella shivajii TaxID=564305 RepID=A0ABZ1CSH0_9TREE|nr:hypothetical protein IL334_001059 [Kwoniella shivajii]